MKKEFVKKLGLLLLALMTGAFTVTAQERMRVVIDNDFAGDPDGLFALAQLALSPSVEVRAVIGSHLHANENWTAKGKPSAATAVENAKALLDGLGKELVVVKGSEKPLNDTLTPVSNAATDVIIAEAMKCSEKKPLYVLCGGGLTEVASAWMLRPEIARRMVLVWIGGAEYPGFIAPPGGTRGEYNTTIDIKASQVVFNRSDLAIWQIPRNAYRQCLVSRAMLRHRMEGSGRAVMALADKLDAYIGPGRPSDCYVLGDNPLVLVSALQSNWERDACSSAYSLRHCPLVDDRGVFHFNDHRRKIKVFDTMDTYLMFEDMFAKFQQTGPSSKPAP